MEQEQNSYSESSSDHKNQANEEMIVARSYDCTFCKRGFTNAQALGGHMNIHRKDKAKAKKENHKNLQDLSFYSKSSIFPRITTPYYGDQSFGGHVNYGVYVPSPSPSGLQTGNHEYCFFPIWRPNNLEDRRDGNLSLRMGTVEDEDEEVDLELRLGRLL